MVQICTELLYQPLTLLDCLHTFCGSCLKEWFFVQGTRRRSSRSAPKFTCPSCRAAVRETRPNATVTTLLDIVLASNPSQAKSAQEKGEIAEKYKPGDSVFPRDDTEDEDEEDGRVLDEVRQLSLQESRSRTRDQRHRAPRQSRARRAERSDHDPRRDDGRSRRRRDDDRSTRRQAHERAARQTEEAAAAQSRRIEHQSSLRSLLSLSDAETMEEEILRQILEEGLLDDIDLDHLGPGQEEELSERIADAYRRRHRLRSRSRQRQETREASHSSGRSRARSHSVQRPTTGPAPPPRDTSRGPPVSRPYLLDPLVTRPGPSTHQRHTSEQGSGRRRTSPTPAHPASSSEANLRPTTRSSSDMSSERPRAPQAAIRTPEPSTRRRRATESGRESPHVWIQGTRERGSSVTRLTNSPTVASPLSNAPQTPAQSAISVVNGSVSHSRPRARSRSNAAPLSYIEPSIICNGCGKPEIQYELHKTCTQCNDGDYHLCLRCYRTGRGCQNWAGFGLSARTNFERILAMSNNKPIPEQETPHIFASSKYKRPSARPRRSTNNDDRQITNEDPNRRLQTGLFCDICSSEANGTFWKCDECNEGDWGFCNTCVNQGKCCTHALLPICRISSSSDETPAETFNILSFATNCDICTHPIPASTTRFHCLVCNDGDYDICANCYLKLGVTGKISKENGHNGWRRCVKGHRMVVVGFEEHEEGQRRVVVRNLVGGRALKDEHVNYQASASSMSSVHAAAAASTASAGGTSTPTPELGTGDWSWKEGAERRKKASRTRTPWINPNNSNPSTIESTPPTPSTSTRRFPPDGGVGVIAQALWSWYPEDGVQDELMFPRGAEITEGENINDDWFWGCYAGVTGLFPGSHVRVVGEVV